MNFRKELKNFISARVVSASTLLLSTSLMLTVFLSNPVIDITIDGKYIGSVKSLAEFEMQIAEVEALATDVMGYPYTLEMEKEYNISYSPVKETLDLDTTKEFLTNYVDEIDTLAIIRVDGVDLVATQTEDEAKEVLEKVLNIATDESTTEVEFVQDIEIVYDFAPVSMLKSVNDATEALTQTESEDEVYTVSSEEETLLQIASSYGVATQAVAVLNPEITSEEMSLGQEIVIQKAKPAVSIETVKEIVQTEEIPYDTQTTEDDALTTTQKRTIKEGSYGEKQITLSVTYVDGVEVSREVLSEEVVKEPVDAIVAIGTQKPVSSGQFLIPTSAKMSSPYGYRSSGFHSGVDFAGPAGTPIVASDGGVVTFVGWNGGYGLCIIIDHGNGFETLYAHNASNAVAVGDVVAQGDYIAAMGTTGNSTGNHVHFEIRVNGVHQNPYNYF